MVHQAGCLHRQAEVQVAPQQYHLHFYLHTFQQIGLEWRARDGTSLITYIFVRQACSSQILSYSTKITTNTKTAMLSNICNMRHNGRSFFKQQLQI